MTHRSLSILLLGLIVALGIGIAPGSIASAAEPGPGEGLVVFDRKKSMKGKAISKNTVPRIKSVARLISPLTPWNGVSHKATIGISPIAAACA